LPCGGDRDTGLTGGIQVAPKGIAPAFGPAALLRLAARLL
jgi:hypothetical protein